MTELEGKFKSEVLAQVQDVVPTVPAIGELKEHRVEMKKLMDELMLTRSVMAENVSRKDPDLASIDRNEIVTTKVRRNSTGYKSWTVKVEESTGGFFGNKSWKDAKIQKDISGILRWSKIEGTNDEIGDNWHAINPRTSSCQPHHRSGYGVYFEVFAHGRINIFQCTAGSKQRDEIMEAING